MTYKGTLIAAALAFATLGAQAAGPERWIHVKVDNPREEERVRVNIPLALVEQILPLVNAEQLKGGRIRIDAGVAGDTDVRAILNAIRQSEDGEYATVEDKTSKVRVRKSRGLLLVESSDSGEGSREKVNVRLPLAVVDALLGAGAEELDVLAAVRALGDNADGMIVDVEDGGERVHIWIDAESGQKE